MAEGDKPAQKRGKGILPVIFGNDTSQWAVDIGLFAVRIVTAQILICHGLSKIGAANSILPGHGYAGAVGAATAGGFAAHADLFAWMVILAEVLGGLLILFGFATRIAAAAIGFEFYIAIAKVHWPAVEKSYRAGHEAGTTLWQYALVDAGNTGFHLPVMLFALALLFLFAGAGRIAVWPGKSRK
jgi:uncharacterized membrane protein YphA (DoxX/SURF4 family)